MIPLKYRKSVSQMEDVLRPRFTHGLWFDADGFSSALRRYGEERREAIRAARKGVDFNPFTEDPNCMGCRKRANKKRAK